jgi:hypothetical protein
VSRQYCCVQAILLCPDNIAVSRQYCCVSVHVAVSRSMSLCAGSLWGPADTENISRVHTTALLLRSPSPHHPRQAPPPPPRPCWISGTFLS